ncbi:nucleoside phosphorylase domain-containing protein [Aspergillus karnatakaensis]|uniref:5'-methylthioadenosine/S-adenosylhomocysteine nucleosidase family protein n=1 Tax=Aspergillus karnatakaensis TaxID=1810916 RepID=UPI003CCCA16E
MTKNRERLLDTLEAFAKHAEEIQCENASLELDPDPEGYAPTENLGDYPDHIKALFDIVVKHCLCSCEHATPSPMDVNVALRACEDCADLDDDNDNAVAFRLFFHGHSECGILRNSRGKWQETRIRVKRQSKVRFSPDRNELDSAYTILETGFCRVISQGSHLPLVFSVANSTLSFIGPVAKTRRWLRHQPCVPITELWSKNKLKKKMRLRLSFVVAKAVWQFYDSDWMLKEWSRENIRFLLERHDDHSQPCLFADEPFLSPNFDCLIPNDGMPEGEVIMQYRLHRYPKILALAILLIEIELGSPIEAHYIPDVLGENGEPNVNTYYSTAVHLLNSQDQQGKWGAQETFSKHKSIIGACLDRNIFNMRDDDVISQRDALYKHVVCPLESLFKIAWTDNDAKILPLQFADDLLETPSQTRILEPPNPTNEKILEENMSDLNIMTRPIRPRSRADFTVAIICALALEADAVEALFDETYDRLGRIYGKQPRDSNAYTNGRIGRHNVVLCYMPEMGKRSAASVASNLVISYTGVQIALVVGTCGGAPEQPSSRESIFLGDVIISEGVVEYDFGRQYPSGFQRKTSVRDVPGRPNQEIRSLLAGLKADRSGLEFRERTFHYTRTLQRANKKWKHPELDDDFFDSTYQHKHRNQTSSVTCRCLHGNSPDDVCNDALQQDCSILGCNDNNVIRRRTPNKSDRVSVHIGPVASADTVMKSGEHRDNLMKLEHVIGFEMEGSGVWDSVSCILIKGVYDYADSHKSKSWQAYAAAAGASAAKTFLEYWKPLTE